MSRRFLPVFVIILTAVATTAFTFGLGGWAVITVEDLPDHLVAGKPVELAFVVRQHGVTLMNGLRPTVFAKSGKTEVQASAIAGKKSGGYTATLVVPATGEWTITIASGFLNNTSTLAPLSAVAPGAPAPRVMAAADRGQQLFIAKGCTTCHVHGAVEGSGRISVGPNLTPKRYQAEYLAKLLDDPSIAHTPGQMNTMPKLELKPVEVAAITAFINAERQVSAKQ